MMKLRNPKEGTAFVSNPADTRAWCPKGAEVEYLDPLDRDSSSDLVLTLSHRELGRLIFIAAQTGARFEREGVQVDPVGWLFSARALFDGRSAVETCHSRKHFIQAIILHGLSIGLDANPQDIEALLVEVDAEIVVHEKPWSPSKPARPLNEFSPA